MNIKIRCFEEKGWCELREREYNVFMTTVVIFCYICTQYPLKIFLNCKMSRAFSHTNLKWWFCCMWVTVKKNNAVIDHFVIYQLMLYCFSILGNLVTVVAVTQLEGFTLTRNMWHHYLIQDLRFCWRGQWRLVSFFEVWRFVVWQVVSDNLKVDIYPRDCRFLCTLGFIYLSCFQWLQSTGIRIISHVWEEKQDLKMDCV